MSKYSSKTRPRSTTKSGYTVFYATSQSSASGSTLSTDVPGAYVDYMAKKRAALCQIEEIPSSMRGSPGAEDDAVSQSRVDDLRKRVQEAFTYANGDTADGKWGTVVQLLRLPVARRTRWLGSTTDGQPPEESSIGWINARTEREWEEWEGRFKQQLLLKQRVQSWQQKVEDTPVQHGPVVSISLDREEPEQSEPLKVKRATTLQNVTVRNQSALSFPVVKRSSLNVVGKPKPTQKSGSNGAIPVAGPSRRAPESQVDKTSSPANAPRKVIEDLSETVRTLNVPLFAERSNTRVKSFLPPSFPSELQTSTPNAKTDRRRKPEPIILVPPSSPLLTPPSVRAYGSQRKLGVSSSLPEPPSTPTRYPKPTSAIASPRISIREKRARSVTPQHAAIKQVKKARTEPVLPVSTPEARVTQSTPAVPITPEITPQRKQLPKLTELLASSKKAKISPRSKTLLRKELLSPPLPEPLPAPPRKAEDEEEEEGEQEEQEPPPEVENDKETFQHSIFDGQDPDTDTYEPLNDTDLGSRVGLHYGIASPAKSLSSLAASESDDEEVHDPLADLDLDMDMSGFEPPFASTQAGAGGGWVGYNSQFDVDGKVDLVSKFIEKDVDFDGWLRDPSAEVEEEDPVESQ
ncbi:hypothetical protein DXG03_003742 [Asterophora parasitica]|uniref:Uncharacterized protein n=1 Tax=Asterophora parasitica TaxID=117018 RepID=A0A9P7KAF4_9AGAR|nr:hypothetical protein DXG03_003742 [Asterophora parasitica]